MNGPNKDQMHPDDIRNLFIFLIAVVALYFAYDHYIQKPNAEAIRQARIAGEKARLEREKSGTVQKEKARPRAEILAGMQRFEFDNGEIFGSIALRGGRINDVAFHNFYETLEKKEPVTLFSPKNTALPRYVDYGWVAADKTIPVPGKDTLWTLTGNDRLEPDRPVTLVWDNGKGLRFERRLELDKNYLFTIEQRVINNTGREVTLYPYGLISQTDIPQDYQKIWFMHEGPTGWIGDELTDASYKDVRKAQRMKFQGQGGWTGIKDKYWMSALIPPQDENIKYRYAYTPLAGGEGKDYGRYQVDFVGPAYVAEPGGQIESRSHVFAGAKKVLVLNEYKKELGAPNLDLAVDFGWLWFLSKPFFYALHYLGQMTGNMGVAIIILTVMIRSAVFPLTNTSYKSFAKMKKVAPQTKGLREKYGEDKQKLQQELVKMYEREGVNPMAGCLPIILQIPIFFALYKTLFVTIEMRHAPFFGWIQDLSAPDPTSVFNMFGLIPWDPPSFLNIGVWPCIMLVAMLIQRNLNPPPQDPLQRDMARYFPFIMTYILSRFASGLVIYWTFSAIIGLIQQIIIMRSLNVPIHLFGETKEEKELDKQIDKGPGVHPLMEMAEEDMEEALFGEDDEDGGVEDKKPKKISPPKKKKKSKKRK